MLQVIPLCGSGRTTLLATTSNDVESILLFLCYAFLF